MLQQFIDINEFLLKDFRVIVEEKLTTQIINKYKKENPNKTLFIKTDEDSIFIVHQHDCEQSSCIPVPTVEERSSFKFIFDILKKHYVVLVNVYDVYFYVYLDSNYFDT